MSTFWSIFVAVLVIGNLVGVVWLLLATSSKKNETVDAPLVDGIPSTGHEWDGIKELNHPLPKWWFNLFMITVVFAVIYMFLYPALGNAEGYLGWTQVNQLEEQMQNNKADRETYFGQFEDISFAKLTEDDQALKTGSRLFANYCAACHGSDARGAQGFPNLSDSDWLYGDSEQALTHSILNGRQGMMPPFEAILSSQQLNDVAEYVQQLSQGSLSEPSTHPGKNVFDMQCMACHGVGGEGNKMLGAPKLNDSVWLYGGSTKDIKTTIRLGRTGNMPSHSNLLSGAEARVLAAYVLSLSADKGTAKEAIQIAN